MTKAIVGVIGGSGVYELEGLTSLREQRVESPVGRAVGSVEVRPVGRDRGGLPRAPWAAGHRFSPSSINYRANIDAVKRAGVTDIIAVSACGSFRREYYPGLFVLVDQFIDRTFRRETSFFGTGFVAHVPMAHPTAPKLRQRIAEAAEAETIAFHTGGTYVCMEGPQFSTLAESLLYQAQGADVIGMTAATEAKLAREADRLRDDRDGHRLRLLARRAWRGRCRLGDEGGARERRSGQSFARPRARRFPASMSCARSAPTGRWMARP